jgi:hypothetical protein
MHRLQTLIDARQKDIDDKVGALRAKLEAEQIQPYRAQLEAEKVTPEMNKLVEFINNIDAMLAYENTETASTETAEQTSETIEHEEVEQVADHSVAEEVSEETETFHDASNDNTAGDNVDAVQHTTTTTTTTTAKMAEELVGTGFEAIAADLADTKAKLQSAVEGRPGMPGIVLPRR